MKNMELNWSLLTRYLAGECSDEEEQIVADYLKEDQENYNKYRLLEKIWNIEPHDEVKVDAREAWDSFQQNVLNKQNQSVSLELNKFQNFNNSNESRKRYYWSRFFAAAAVVLITFFIHLFLTADADQKNNLAQNEPNKVIKTEMGERTSLRLADGTIVYLNANSSLEIPTSYGDSLRKVRLDGEAFFEVVDDAKSPFIVQSETFKTRVIGTRFNVSAYPCISEDKTCENEVQVVVEEGEVELGRENQTGGSSIHAYQKGKLGASGKTVVEDVSDLATYIGWKDGKLVFDSTSFDEVIKRLENWYNIDVQVGPSLKSQQLTASFEGESLSQVLDVVALSLDAEYTIEGRKVTLRSK